MMKVIIDENAIKDLSKLDKKLTKKIFSKIEELQNFPNITNIKKLVNFYPPYRLRVGDYRVLFDIKDEIVTVYKIRHRKKVYK